MSKVVGFSNTAATIERMAQRRPVVAFGVYFEEDGTPNVFYAENDGEHSLNSYTMLGAIEVLRQYVFEHETDVGGLMFANMDGSVDVEGEDDADPE